MIFVSVCTGRVPRSRTPHHTHMAVAWFERPTRDPFAAPPIVVGGTSAAHARSQAIETATAFRRGEEVEDLRPAWASAHRFRMRGEPAWPEQRKARKAAEAIENAIHEAKWRAAEHEQKTAAPFAHLTDAELKARLREFEHDQPRSRRSSRWASPPTRPPPRCVGHSANSHAKRTPIEADRRKPSAPWS